ncbi:hypothetical protein PUR34_15130 [Streptomyces sp. JV185]|uniref:hypothetical protein n=1 Tax=Streptomyces sp. JV185 TaxID=858638 RepID=UPI002E77A6A4|nr:hypothetical protein [Streptomyces sp. JV185]MEE1769442.1 hypothetical protein [Streptomyces sp. JV185]
MRNDGYEYLLVLVVVSAALTFTGPGRRTLDHTSGATDRPVRVAVAVIALGPAGGVLTHLVLHRRPLAPEARTHAQAAE